MGEIARPGTPVPWEYEGDDVATVVCAKFSQRMLRMVPGSREGRCHGCRRLLVVGPRVRELAAQPDVRLVFTVCIRCIQAHVPGKRANAVMPGVVEDVAAGTGLSKSSAGRLVRGMSEIPFGEHDPDVIDGEGFG